MYKAMAQSKEYSKNDFLYSGYDTQLIGPYDCNRTDVQWDDLIQESCNRFTQGTVISLIINGKYYKVTTEGNSAGEINTISEIANEFKKISPYNFSYKSSNNSLIIDATTITFNIDAATTKKASSFLGYNENNVQNKLPYTFPNKITISASAEAASLYAFDLSYNISLNNNKLSVDIRADGTNKKPYYSDKSLVSGFSEPISLPAYVNNLQLVQHLNKKMIGYRVNPNQTSYDIETNDIGNCFYKFNYDYSKGALIVSDLILYSTPAITTTNTFTFTAGSTDANGARITKDYTYKITKPIDSGIRAETADDVIMRDGKFRKFDIRTDANWNTDGTFKEYKPGYNKITPPTIKTEGYGAITGVYINGLFVCGLNDINTPTFQIAFDTIGGSNIIVMCSGTKYVKIDDAYYTLPYTKVVTNGTNGSNNDECKIAQRNKSLCDNKKSAQTIMDKTQKHPGFDQQYIDAKGFSDMSVLNIINLGIGIITATYFIAKTYK
jgi:hypothetical protein